MQFAIEEKGPDKKPYKIQNKQNQKHHLFVGHRKLNHQLEWLKIGWGIGPSICHYSKKPLAKHKNFN